MPLTAADLHCPPTYATQRTPDRPTLGPSVGRVAAMMGRPLKPHQQLIADVALEIDTTTGLLAYSEVDVIINRQQGKSELTFPIMTHRCTGFDAALARWVKRELGIDVPEPGPQRVLYTAQRAEDARQKWRDIHVKRLEALNSPFRSKVDVRKRLAAEQITWPNGSTWSPGSATKKAGGTGDTLDLGMIDEGWSQQDSSTELAMRPTMLTRDWAQLWVLSMIPGLSRAAPGTWPYLHQKRQNGRARVQAGMRRGVAYFEWSMREGRDPADPATWWETMPGLAAGLVTEQKIRDDFEAMTLVDFMAEYLSVEPSGRSAGWTLVSELTWRNLKVPAVRGRYLDPIALGVDAAPDQSVATIGMAALDVRGDTYVEVVARAPGLNWAVPALVEVAERMGACSIGIAAHGPAAPIIEPLRRALDEAKSRPDAYFDTELVIMQGPQVAQACVQMFMETGELGDGNEADPDRRVRHPDDADLNAAVAAATKYTWGDEWRFARSGDGGEISALYGVTLARAAGEAVEWLGGSYDIESSLG
jgi:hypothetical protein